MLRDVLAAEPPRPTMAVEQIKHIEDSGRRMLGMVDALLVDAMQDALDINLRLEVIDVGSLVQQVSETNRRSAESKQQQISVEAEPGLVVKADHDRLFEAVDNLLSNAIKYTPAGGKIALKVDRTGKKVRVTVTDTGLGLSPEDLARLFGRFQRLSAKPTAGESSTGLGLSIVKKIVELHGGEVSGKSAGPNKGTSFTIALPLERSA
jgi:signal transduction histidine kinase